MTAKELFDILEQAIHDGHGNAPVYFDTEGRTYNYHMAKVGSAYCQECFGPDTEVWITLHEERVK
jgi:hypothetical protein